METQPTGPLWTVKEDDFDWEELADHDAHRRRNIKWFLSVFLAAFVGVAFFVRVLVSMGSYVLICPLWNYYLIELDRMINPSPFAGSVPTFDAGGFILTLILHFTFSGTAGAVILVSKAVLARKQRR